MTHTPGPWHVFDNQKDKHFPKNDAGLIGVGSKEHSDVAHCHGFNGSRHPDEELANAKLIAAAPELLEALQALMESRRRDQYKGWEEGVPDFHKSEALAKAAIAKATE